MRSEYRCWRTDMCLRTQAWLGAVFNQLVDVLRLINSGAMNCAPTLEHEMLKPVSRGAIHRVRGRPLFYSRIREMMR